MANRSLDHELRRHVLKLASFAPTDFDAIVQKLDDKQRKTVLSMLDELEGKSKSEAQQEPVSVTEPVVLPAELSSWLVARVNGKSDYGEETADPFTISPHAQQALRRCAAAMAPQPPAKRANPSLLDRVWQGLAQ